MLRFFGIMEKRAFLVKPVYFHGFTKNFLPAQGQHLPHCAPSFVVVRGDQSQLYYLISDFLWMMIPSDGSLPGLVSPGRVTPR
jgi:hypothetical protein